MSAPARSLRSRLAKATLFAISLGVLAVYVVPSEPAGVRVPNLDGVVPIVQSSSGGGACDVNGVTVGYRTAYRTTPSRRYVVAAAVVQHVSWPSCDGATVTVTLTNTSSQTIGSGQVPVGGTPAGGEVATPVPMSPQPDAAAVTGVAITLSGGTTPVPAECNSIKFDFTAVGTLGNETINGTNGNDLIYTLEGVDTVNGFNGTDCITGGPNAGDDTTIVEGTGSTGNNVILAGDGNDSVTAGNGNNLVKLGNGNDTVNAGNGANTIYLGKGTDSVTVGNGNDTIFTGGRTSTSWPSGPTSGVGTTVVRIGNGKSVNVYGGYGNDTIYLGSGTGTIDGGGGTNVCHVPSVSKSKYTIIRCAVVAP